MQLKNLITCEHQTRINALEHELAELNQWQCIDPHSVEITGVWRVQESGEMQTDQRLVQRFNDCHGRALNERSNRDPSGVQRLHQMAFDHVSTLMAMRLQGWVGSTVFSTTNN